MFREVSKLVFATIFKELFRANVRAIFREVLSSTKTYLKLSLVNDYIEFKEIFRPIIRELLE